MNRNYSRMARLGRILFGFYFLFVFTWTQPVNAQDQLPGVDSLPGGKGTQDPLTGYYFSKPGDEPDLSAMMMDTGGDFYYGYTYSDEGSYTYLTSSNKTNRGITNATYSLFGPVNIGFSFNYYENTYTQLYIGKNGFVTFAPSQYYIDQDFVPEVDYLNNVIAAYWSPMYMTTSSRVYTWSSGSSPNRLFVIEWSQMRGGSSGDEVGGNETYTFQIVLRENGNIELNYQTMTYSDDLWYWCGGSGIEDMRGYDGLTYNWCGEIPGHTTVRITRPAPTGRVLLYPVEYGIFGTPGRNATITVPLKNIGNVGSDTFDLEATCFWPVTFRNKATGEHLVDTTGDSLVDTGPLAQNQVINVLVDLQVPNMANVGEYQTCTLFVYSQNNVSMWRYAELYAAISAPYTQIYRYNISAAVRLAVNQPDSQKTFTSSSSANGYTPAVAEAPNGDIVSVWTQERTPASGADYVSEVYYSIHDRDGVVVRSATRLADVSGLGSYVYDYYPTVTVALNGTIGIAFRRLRINASNLENENAYLARLDGSGGLLGITNLTGYTAFTSYNAIGHPRVYDTTIASTPDNRFQVVWRLYAAASGGSYNNIYFAARSTDGSLVTSPVAITADSSSSDDGYFDPAITTATGNEVIIAYRKRWQEINRTAYDIVFQAKTSNGGNGIAETMITTDGSNNLEYRPDVVKLSNGDILVAWHTVVINYAILDDQYNNSIGVLSLDSMSNYDWNSSVTADQDGRAIFSWIDDTEMTSYYALVDSFGTPITPSMPVLFSSSGIRQDYLGWNITSRTISPTTTDTDLYLDAPVVVPVPAGGSRDIQVYLGNLGLQPTSTINVSLTKPGAVVINDTNPTASCGGNSCTWNFPGSGLMFMGGGTVSFNAGIPSVAPGTIYNLTLHILSPETDPRQSNNTLVISLVESYPGYIPLIRK